MHAMVDWALKTNYLPVYPPRTTSTSPPLALMQALYYGARAHREQNCEGCKY